MIAGTAKQMELLRYIAGYQESHGVSPTYEEAKDALGLKNKSVVFYRLKRLEERKLLTITHRLHRSIQLHHIPSIPRSPTGEPLYFVRVK